MATEAATLSPTFTGADQGKDASLKSQKVQVIKIPSTQQAVSTSNNQTTENNAQPKEKASYALFAEKAESIKQNEIARLRVEKNGKELTPKDLLAVDKKIYREARKFVRSNYTFGEVKTDDQQKVNDQIEKLTDKYIHSALVTMTVENEDARPKEQIAGQQEGESTNDSAEPALDMLQRAKEQIKNAASITRPALKPDTSNQQSEIIEELNEIADSQEEVAQINTPPEDNGTNTALSSDSEISQDEAASNVEENTEAETTQNDIPEIVLPVDTSPENQRQNSTASNTKGDISPKADSITGQIDEDPIKQEFTSLAEQLDNESNPAKREELTKRLQEIADIRKLRSEASEKLTAYRDEEDPVKRDELRGQMEEAVEKYDFARLTDAYNNETDPHKRNELQKSLQEIVDKRSGLINADLATQNDPTSANTNVNQKEPWLTHLLRSSGSDRRSSTDLDDGIDGFSPDQTLNNNIGDRSKALFGGDPIINGSPNVVRVDKTTENKQQLEAGDDMLDDNSSNPQDSASQRSFLRKLWPFNRSRPTDTQEPTGKDDRKLNKKTKTALATGAAGVGIAAFASLSGSGDSNKEFEHTISPTTITTSNTEINTENPVTVQIPQITTPESGSSLEQKNNSEEINVENLLLNNTSEVTIADGSSISGEMDEAEIMDKKKFRQDIYTQPEAALGTFILAYPELVATNKDIPPLHEILEKYKNAENKQQVLSEITGYLDKIDPGLEPTVPNSADAAEKIAGLYLDSLDKEGEFEKLEEQVRTTIKDREEKNAQKIAENAIQKAEEDRVLSTSQKAADTLSQLP